MRSLLGKWGVAPRTGLKETLQSEVFDAPFLTPLSFIFIYHLFRGECTFIIRMFLEGFE